MWSHCRVWAIQGFPAEVYVSHLVRKGVDVTDVPRNPRLTVLGAGYLGAAHAACLADMGFEVLGVDTDPARVELLGRGSLPFFEPGLEPLLRRGLDSGRLQFSTSYPQAAAFGDVHFICVGTPQRAGGDSADLSQVTASISILGPLLKSPCLVVGKSTVPAGTAAMLATDLKRLAPAGDAVELAWNPEFLREGHAVEDTLRPDRIVVGVQSTRAELLLRQIYAQQIAADRSFFVTDLVTAELAKTAANAFLATKISFINAMAEVCSAAGGDVLLLSRVLGSDPRIGPSFLAPGLGFGGACLPKDIRAFQARATELGVGEALRFLREVDAINLRCRLRVVDLAQELAGGELAGRAVGVLGAAFKPDSDDVRDSRPWPWPAGCPAWVRTSRFTTQSRLGKPGRPIRNWGTRRRSWTPPRMPTCFWCSPNGRSSVMRTRRSWLRRWPSATWWTPVTHSTRPSGKALAGITGRPASVGRGRPRRPCSPGGDIERGGFGLNAVGERPGRVVQVADRVVNRGRPCPRPAAEVARRGSGAGG